MFRSKGDLKEQPGVLIQGGDFHGLHHWEEPLRQKMGPTTLLPGNLPTSREMAHWVKTLAAKPESPSSIPRTHMVEKENLLLHVVLWSPHTCHDTQKHIHRDPHTINK